MIEEIAVTVEVGYTTVVGKRLGVAQRHNLTSILPRACRRRSRTVRDMLRYTTGSIKQLVCAITLGEPRTLCVRILILLTLFALAHNRATKGFLSHVETAQFTAIRYHVAVEFQVVALRITPHEPCLSVVVNHDGGIDMVPRAILEQRFTNSITERACRRIAHSHTNSHTLRNLRVGADVPVELTVTFDGLSCPGTVISPRETLQSQG